MPIDPIDLRIVQNLQAALQGISSAAGYHYTVAALAVKLDPNVGIAALIGDLAARPFIVLEVLPDQFEYQQAKAVKVRMPITIHLVHDADATVDGSWLEVWSRLCADAEQAIAVDIRRGGLAVDTKVLTREFATYDGTQVWAMVKTEVLSHRRYGLPNG